MNKLSFIRIIYVKSSFAIAFDVATNVAQIYEGIAFPFAILRLNLAGRGLAESPEQLFGDLEL